MRSARPCNATCSNRKWARPLSFSRRISPAASPARSHTSTAVTTSWGFRTDSGGFRLHLENNPPRIAIERCHQNLTLAALHHAGKLLAPLHQHDAVLRLQVIEPQRLQLALAFDAIEVQVVESHGR